MLLSHHLASVSDTSDGAKISTALQRTFQQYMQVRKAHVERILDAGNRGGDASRDMNPVLEYTVYAFFWLMCKQPPSSKRCNRMRG